MERMSTLDAGFFFVEHENVPMHLGSLALFEGPAPGYEELIRLFSAKLPAVPRYRQVVRTTPLQVFRPYWVDDEHFDIGYHVRHAAVPAPGGKRQLRELAAQILAQRLDRSRPLWEAWLLEGLKGGRWAILSKVHHCVVDGIGGNDLMTAVFDLGPDAERPAPVEWEPEPEPTMLDLLTVGLRDTFSWPLRQLARLPGLLGQPLPSAGEILGYGRGLTASAQRLAVPSAASLNGPIGPNRRWSWARATLSEVKEIRGALGGTVNDVLLAVITRGFRDLLEARGELAEGLVVRSLVPVSVRRQDEQGVLTNRVSAVLANLPVGEPDPLRRLALLREEMDDLKRTSQAVGAEFLTGMLGFAVPTLLALGSRAAFQIPQPLVQTVTTNVPGPRFPLFLIGRKLVRIYPYVPIGDNERISVAIISYLDRFSFGITADYDAVPDLGVLTKGIRRGLTELRDSAAESGRAATG
ncbi:MAG TPA: wax ester/triacylglycerol synthase family O-acyltransferase [Streptosporangiaceae bacterium]|nr:wax ester/triacylglycerol synthase family O-acyltransferase [Streptosporangiaceae bacterium]